MESRADIRDAHVVRCSYIPYIKGIDHINCAVLTLTNVTTYRASVDRAMGTLPYEVRIAVYWSDWMVVNRPGTTSFEEPITRT